MLSYRGQSVVVWPQDKLLCVFPSCVQPLTILWGLTALGENDLHGRACLQQTSRRWKLGILVVWLSLKGKEHGSHLCESQSDARVWATQGSTSPHLRVPVASRPGDLRTKCLSQERHSGSLPFLCLFVLLTPRWLQVTHLSLDLSRLCPLSP